MADGGCSLCLGNWPTVATVLSIEFPFRAHDITISIRSSLLRQSEFTPFIILIRVLRIFYYVVLRPTIKYTPRIRDVTYVHLTKSVFIAGYIYGQHTYSLHENCSNKMILANFIVNRTVLIQDDPKRGTHLNSNRRTKLSAYFLITLYFKDFIISRFLATII